MIGGLIALWITYKGVKCACECTYNICACCYDCICCCCKRSSVKPQEAAPKAVEIAPVKAQPPQQWAAPSPGKMGGRQGDALEVTDVESARN